MLALWTLFYAVPKAALLVPQVQRTIAAKASEALSAQLNVPVTVGSVTVEWLNRLVLKEVSLDDRRGERLFEADHLSAGFKLAPLFRKKWVFTTVRLFGFSLNLNRETDGSPLNLQFVLDALASKDTAQHATPYLQIHSILFQRGNVRYDVADAPAEHRKFDAKHLHVQELGGQISLEMLRDDSLSLHIRKVSLRERSGFRLDKLSMNLSGNRQGISVSNLDIRLPESLVQITGAHLRFPEADSAAASTPAWTDWPVGLHLEPSRICLRDLAAFAPVLRNFTEQMELSADFSGELDDLSVHELTLKQNGTLSLLGKLELKDITRPEATFLSGNIDRLQLTAGKAADIVNRLQEAPFTLPAPLMRLEQLTFSGEISGLVNHLAASGNLQSEIGDIEMNMRIERKREENRTLSLTGRAVSSELNIGRLFDEGNPLGTVRFSVELDASLPANGSLAGNIRAQVFQFDYNRYRYENLLLAGDFSRREFNGRIDVDDNNGKLHAEGFVKNNGEYSAFHFSAHLADFRPDRLNLLSRYEQPKISLNLVANFTGNHPDNFIGQIAVNDFSFATPAECFRLDTLQLDAVNKSDGRKLTLRSDILNGEINGTCSFASMLPSLLRTARVYLPSLPLKESERTAPNGFYLTMTVENTESLAGAFKWPFANIEQGQLSGRYDNRTHSFRLDALLPKFKIGKSVFEYGSVELGNAEGQVRLQAKTAFVNKKGIRSAVEIHSDAANDRINTQLSFASLKNRDSIARINLSASALFVADKDENGKQTLRTEITLEPNRIIVRDSIWNMEPASATIMNGNTTIDNFYISKGEQYLRINGTASVGNPKEAILVDLNDIELSHIFDIVNIPALQFGGRATGVVSLNNLYGTPVMNTKPNLTVRNFSFNQVVQGELELFSEWDSDEEGILLRGTIRKSDSIRAKVDGYIYPVGAKEGLSIRFDAQGLDLSLLHPYVDGFTKVVGGFAYGNIRLFGPFSKLSFEGQAFVSEGRIGVNFLNTAYTFSDTVRVTPASFQGKEIAVHDASGNRGTVSFDVQHNYLEDFTFLVTVQAQNLLVYDAPQSVNPQIYGALYGSGNAQIKGTGQQVTVDATIQSNPKTSLAFSFMNGSTAGEYDFISFRDRQAEATPRPVAVTPRPAGENEDDGAEVHVNCLVEVTPDASLELVMDRTSGDRIRGNGSGDVQIQYDSRTDMVAMHGGYTIRNGSYNFSLQQLIRKDFQLREGSRIDFRGDPMEADLSLQAIYFLTANIEDLDQSLTQETLRTSIPINCVLNLNGHLRNPTISFDMELPNSTGELARQVKSFIDTEDMMARQIVYLLALNKFYTPDYSRNDYRSNEFSAVASSALSSQLSNILNSLTDKVQIGTNIRSRQDGVTDTEIEMLLSSQLLDNRLLFNGNFGYKNNFIQTSAFIGEFDLEYKLTPSGEVRLKAYNHANDMYRYNMKSLTRQGVGLMYYKDFDSFANIFRRRKTATPTEPEDNPADSAESAEKSTP
ncbi:MAG: translocation/assembly module TamB domain-containing protein [Tannerella sp.]|nr:translocation/assembly module TamB domain-containing protein [Tannerella sp.]